jgi:hypothetical protein
VTVGFSELTWRTFLAALHWTFRQPARIPLLSSTFDSDYNDKYVKPILKSTTVDTDIIYFVQFSGYAAGINNRFASGRSEHCSYFSADGKRLHLVGVAGGTISRVGLLGAFLTAVQIGD